MSTAGAGNVADDQVEEDQEGPVNPRRCAACKYMRRRCSHDCVLAPYFPASQTRRYACVHRVFGASNVARLLQSLPEEERGHAAETMAVEAEWRVCDPVYGCTGMINRLQEEISAVECELARTLAQLAIVDVRGARQQAPPPPAAPLPPPPPPPPPQVVGGAHPVVDDVQMQGDDEHEAPLLDPDDFLDLDGF